MQHDDLLRHESLVQPAKAIEMLKADRRRVPKLLQRYEATNEPDIKQRIAMALCVAFALHTQVEETVFYPAFEETTNHAGHAFVDTSLEDLEQIEVFIEALRGLEADSEAFAVQFHELRLTVVRCAM